MSDKSLVRHKSRMSDFRTCLTDCLIINGLHKSKSDMSDFLVRLMQSRKGKQYQCHEPLNKSNNDPPILRMGPPAVRRGGPYAASVPAVRRPPSSLPHPITAARTTGDDNGPN